MVDSEVNGTFNIDIWSVKSPKNFFLQGKGSVRGSAKVSTDTQTDEP